MKAIKATGVERALHDGSMLVRVASTHYTYGIIRSLSGSLFQPFSLIFVIVLFSITYSLPGFNIIFAAALYLIQKIFTYLDRGVHSIR